MPDKKQEATSEPNQEEEKTSENQSQENETPTKESESSGDKLKEYKARMEHHKNKQKELEEELEKVKSQLPSEEDAEEDQTSKDDVDQFLEMRSATEGLEKKEVEHLKLVADAKDVSLSEAREDEDFELWQEARRKKVERDKQTPEPDSRQPSEEKDYSDWTPEDLRKASDDEKMEYLNWKKDQEPGAAKF